MEIPPDVARRLLPGARLARAVVVTIYLSAAFGLILPSFFYDIVIFHLFVIIGILISPFLVFPGCLHNSAIDVLWYSGGGNDDIPATLSPAGISWKALLQLIKVFNFSLHFNAVAIIVVPGFVGWVMGTLMGLGQVDALLLGLAAGSVLLYIILFAFEDVIISLDILHDAKIKIEPKPEKNCPTVPETLTSRVASFHTYSHPIINSNEVSVATAKILWRKTGSIGTTLWLFYLAVELALLSWLFVDGLGASLVVALVWLLSSFVLLLFCLNLESLEFAFMAVTRGYVVESNERPTVDHVEEILKPEGISAKALRYTKRSCYLSILYHTILSIGVSFYLGWLIATCLRVPPSNGMLAGLGIGFAMALVVVIIHLGVIRDLKRLSFSKKPFLAS